ncbi:MAG: OmpA family protein [Nitrospinaceae bacterium]
MIETFRTGVRFPPPPPIHSPQESNSTRNPAILLGFLILSVQRGTSNYNISLGERRADFTKRYLVFQGVDSGRLHAIRYGKEKPFCLDGNETCEH